ncbi:MAG: BON domain-containing protein [Bryobacteraceae bacterium]
MKQIALSLLGTGLLLTVVVTGGCTASANKSPAVADSVHDAERQAGLKDVTVSQDRVKAVVTLKGTVASEEEKNQAETIAKSLAPGQIVANEIAVLPPGGESTAKAVNSNLDAAINKNLAAALIAHNRLDKRVDTAVKNGVVTLTGSVTSEQIRHSAEKVAASVPNVQQVVNKIDVKDRKATSTK